MNSNELHTEHLAVVRRLPVERSGTSGSPLADATGWRPTLDGGVSMSKRIFLAMASLAALVLSSGAGFTWS